MKMVTEDYVSFDTAKLLKEKGFGQLTYACFAPDGEEYYGYRAVDDDIMRPTLQMAMKWLREAHKLYIVVRPYVTEEGFFSLFDVKSVKEKGIVVNIRTKTGFTTYEEACESAIK